MATFEERARAEAVRRGISGLSNGFHSWMDAALWAYEQGAAVRERELREPMACGHPKACWIGPDHLESYGQASGYCSACRREQALRDALEKFPDAKDYRLRDVKVTTFDAIGYAWACSNWSKTVRAEALLGGGK